MIPYKILVGFDNKIYPEVECFSALGQCSFHKYSTSDLTNKYNDINGLITHTNTFTSSEILKSLKNLKFVATPSTGTNHIDIEYIKNNNIAFFSLNDDRRLIDGINSTAEHAWLLLLASARNLVKCNERVQNYFSWKNSDLRGIELAGKTLGLVGLGRLGKQMAQYAKAFGMNVQAYDPFLEPIVFHKARVKSVDLIELFKSSDCISVHAKLNASNYNLINSKLFSIAKEGIILVNTARGELINSADLINALKRGIVGSVGLDVLNGERSSLEELPPDPIIAYSKKNNNVIITPHVGGATLDAHSKVFNGLLDIIKKSETI